MDIQGLLGSTDMMQALVAGASGLATLAIGSMLWLGNTRAGAERSRRQMIERHRQTLRSESLRRGRDRRDEGARAIVERLVALFSLIPGHVRDEKRREITAAGIYSPHAPLLFWAAKISLLLLAAVATLVVVVLRPADVFGVPSYALPIALSLGFLLPDLVLRQRRAARLKALQRGLPDGLDLLVICAEAGLSLDAALKRVADEFATAVPEMSEELLLTSVELNFLPDRRQALMNLSQRVDLPGFRGVVTTLIQTEKYGTPLAATLRTLSAEFREHRLLAAEEKAARLPAILTVPMIVFILPALFIVLAAPAAIQISRQLMQQ